MVKNGQIVDITQDAVKRGAWLIGAERAAGPDESRSVTFGADGDQPQVEVGAGIRAGEKTDTRAA